MQDEDLISENDDNSGYASPNDMSPSNFHQTLHNILDEEKEKRLSSQDSTPGSNDNR